MSVGLQILKNLGLTDEEAERMSKENREQPNSIYARDQSGLGFKKVTTNYIAEANDIFARLSKNMPQMQSSNVENASYTSSVFVPSRLRKKSITSLSTEDLATILSKPDEDEPVKAPEVEHKRRRKHKKVEELQ